MTPKRSILLGLLVIASSGGCAKMLGLEQKDPDVNPFEHRAHLLEGINCLECHQGVQNAGEKGPLHLPTTEDCVACHAEPHDPNTCENCHGLESTRRRARMARKHLVFTHDSHTKAEAGDCVRCHVDVQHEEHHLRPSMATCLSCHEHEDQWDLRDCDSCHYDLQSDGTLPASHLVHDDDFLRQHGVLTASSADLCTSCHTETQCAECHGVSVPAIPSRFFFDEPMRQTMHRAGFFGRHPQESLADPGVCTICHSEVFCLDCHSREGISALDPTAINPHPPGWVGPPGSSNEHGRQARLDPVQCASCHGGAGEMLCVGCHRVGGPGGNPHPPGFESRLNIRNDPPCRFCHVGSP